MGTALRQLAAAREDVRITGGIGSSSGDTDGIPISTLRDCGPLFESADVVIDFSSAATTRSLLEQHAGALQRCAVVCGTTGLDPETTARLERLSEQAPVVVASNFSVGVNLLMALTRKAAGALPPGEWDVEVVEVHHRRKVDAPSGTALSLARAVTEGRGVTLDDVRRDGRSGETGSRPHGEIGMHAVRGGGVTGDHDVHFLAARERITLHHQALDRMVFAEGALRAALWLHGREAALYDMDDVLGLRS